MSFKNLLLTVAVALAVIWALGLFIRVVAWVLDIAIVVAGILFIWWVVQNFIDNKRTNR